MLNNAHRPFNVTGFDAIVFYQLDFGLYCNFCSTVSILQIHVYRQMLTGIEIETKPEYN